MSSSPRVPVLVIAGVSSGVAGLLPAPVRMERTGLTIGYREVATTIETLLGPIGTRARGHEFHRSTLGSVPAGVARAYSISDGREDTVRLEGYAVGCALMSYAHLHFGSNPAVERSFVSACARR